MFESRVEPAEPAGGSADNIEMQDLTSRKYYLIDCFLNALIYHIFLSKKKPLLNMKIRKVISLRE